MAVPEPILETEGLLVHSGEPPGGVPLDDLMLRVWRATCQHMEITESTSAIARLLHDFMPRVRVIVRQIDRQRGVIETWADTGLSTREEMANLRTSLNAHQIRRLDNLWRKQHVHCVAALPSSDDALNCLLPTAEHRSAAIVGRLTASRDFEGALIVIAVPGERLTSQHGLSLSVEGVLYGSVVSLRLVAVLAAGTLVVFTTHPADLILALTKLGLPHWFAFMLTLALRFLPETIEQAKRILVAQQLRGAGGRGVRTATRRFRLLVVPLMTALLRSARQIAMAAEVRAYSARRIPSRELRFSRWDWGALMGLSLLTVAGCVAAWYSAAPTTGVRP